MRKSQIWIKKIKYKNFFQKNYWWPLLSLMYGIGNLSTKISILNFEIRILELGIGRFNKIYWAG